MKIKIFLLSIFLCSFFAIHAQETTILKGNVVDAFTGAPIPGATFIIETTSISQKTAENGTFLIDKDLPFGEFTARITKQGYIPRRFTIVIKEGNSATINTIRMKGLSKRQIRQGRASLPEEDLIELGTIIKGNISDKNTSEALAGVSVRILGTTLEKKTDKNGNYIFDKSVPSGEHILEIGKNHYITAQKNIDITGKQTGTVEGILLKPDPTDMENILVNTFAHDELYTEFETVANTSRFYQNSSDDFLQTAAYNFSPAFFKLRGQDARSGKTHINGVEINTIANGKTEWSTFAGLEEISTNTNFSRGLSASNYGFGGANGLLNISTLASQYRKGGKVSYQSSNRSFVHGVNATYATGPLDNGWALAVSASKRITFEGYYDGMTYDLSSFFISAEKRVNEQHTFGLMGIFTPTLRDKYAAVTQEVLDLKGSSTYNPYWGLLNDVDRNSRSRDIVEPIVQLTHLWQINPEATLLTTLGATIGSTQESRLDNFGTDIDASGDIVSPFVEDPNPITLERLPSFFLRDQENPDLEGAAQARDNLITDGQINWPLLYATNANTDTSNASYILYEDVTKKFQIDINTLLNASLTDYLSINASLGATRYTTDNFARIKDLLGTKNYLDITPLDGTGDELQSDLENPNRLVQNDGIFRYNYELQATKVKGFGQVQYKKDALNAFIGIHAIFGNYTRKGLFLNGASPESSLGSQEYSNTDYGIKAGLEYEIAPKHKVGFNARYTSQAPTLNTIFYNARENSNLIESVDEDIIPIVPQTSLDVSARYHHSGDKIAIDIIGYYTSISDAMEATLFNGTEINGLRSNAITQVLSGIDQIFAGLEASIAYKITEEFTIKGVASVGDYRYDNNPNLSYVFNESTVLNLGESALQETHVPGGPEQAFSFEVAYRNSANWWVSASGNYFAKNFIAVNPYRRTTDFFEDNSGNTFVNFTPTDARRILRQEILENYYLVNAALGKFWQVNNNHIGIKVGVSNALGQAYKISGFEDTTLVKFDELLADSTRQQAVYTPKFWTGFSTNYFANVFYRF